MTSRIRMLHLSPSFFGDMAIEREVLTTAFDDAVVIPHGDDASSLLHDPVEAEVLVTFGTEIGPDLMDAVKPSVIAVYATGTDWVDVEAATDRDIAVTSVPAYCDREVGEHVVAMALALCRGLPQYDASTRSGTWDWSVANPLRAFDETTVGFLAFGRKARSAAALFGPLGFDRIAHDPYVDDSVVREAGVEPVEFDELLARSNVLSIHAPLTDETNGMLDREALGRLPDGAVLINAGRGAIVEDEALLWALESGPLSGAGLDVFSQEPPSPDNPLLDRDDTVVTPHVAWNSAGAIERIRTRGTEVAVAALQGDAVEGVVNPVVFETTSFDPRA